MPRPPDSSPKIAPFAAPESSARQSGRERDRSRVAPTQRGFGYDPSSPRGALESDAFDALDRTRAEQDRDEDRMLLSRAAQGDEIAVRKLYRAHVGKLLRHAARILGPTDPDVEDVVQQ